MGPGYDPAPMRASTAVPVWFGCLLVLGAIVQGCASQSQETKARVDKLEIRQSQLQATVDRLEERLAAVENAARAQASRPAPAMDAASESTRPDLPLYRLGPEGASPPPASAGAAPTSDDGPVERPLIVGEGSRVETRTVSGPEASSPPPSSKNSPKGTRRSSRTSETGTSP